MAEKKFEFDIIENYDYASFVTSVESSLNEGWELHGNMIAFPNYTDDNKVESVRYIQAIVKKNASSKPKSWSVPG